MRWLYLAAAVLFLLAGLRAALRLGQDRSTAITAYAVGMTASGGALLWPALDPSLLRLAPPGSPESWAVTVLGLAGAWALRVMMAAVMGKAGGPPVFQVAGPVAGAAFAALTWAGLEQARHTEPGTVLPLGLKAGAAGLILLGLYCPALAEIRALAWQCAQQMPARHIALALRAVSAAAAAEAALTVARTAEVVTALSGTPSSGTLATTVNAAQGVAAAQFVIGAAVPVWLPAVTAACHQSRSWFAWFRLRPLWALMLDGNPDVRLPPQPGTRLAARYRLHRRVIEIRDAQLALRPFVDAQAAAEAADAARSAGLPQDEHDAVIEAVMIATALDARRHGASPDGSRGGSHVLPDPANDLESEVDRLVRVSRAVRRSPIVRRALLQLVSGSPDARSSRRRPEAGS